MLEVLNGLRELNICSVMLRLLLAAFVGGLIGLERTRKRRPAGFRTYMLVCIGAALTMILSQYEYVMLTTVWAEAARSVGVGTDVSRFGAQAINGIGFLGAGTILVTGRNEVKGMTTAACLWASACVGLAIGAGFYWVALFAFLMVLLTFSMLSHLEHKLIGNDNGAYYIEVTDLPTVVILFCLRKNMQTLSLRNQQHKSILKSLLVRWNI